MAILLDDNNRPVEFTPTVLKAHKSCAIPECDAYCNPAHLMCRRHWYMVSQSLQNTIWRTLNTDIAAYRTAVAQAVAAVMAREGRS